MKTGKTLDKLIKVANISKTDFAYQLSISPSGLSRILSGNNLPPKNDMKSFIQESARILSENIYDFHCYLKLKEVFPFIYDFKSKIELQFFLENALEYAIKCDYDLEDNKVVNNSFNECSYLGTHLSFNIFCIVVSELLTSAYYEKIEIFTNIPIFNYPSIFPFNKIKILSNQNINMIFNVSTHIDTYGSEDTHDTKAFLSHLNFLEDFINLRLYHNPNIESTSNFYLYVENRFIISLQNLGDDLLVLTNIKHKGFLDAFSKNIEQDFKYQRTFLVNDPNEKKLIDKLVIDNFTHTPITLISNFPIHVYESYIDKIENEIVNKLIKNIYKNMEQFDYYVTNEALILFCFDKKIHIPFIGDFDIPKEERINYLKQLKHNSNNQNKVIYDAENLLPINPLICSKDLCLVYVKNTILNREKIHIIKSNRIEYHLREILDSGKVVPYNIESNDWKEFVEQLSKGYYWI